MSSNGQRPPRRHGPRVRRPVALLVGAVAALLIAGVLVAPIVILGSGSKAKPCAQTLRFRGLRYTARPVPQTVANIAIGTGTATGCGAPATQVNVRSVEGVPAIVAVAVAGESASVYVRPGVCPHATQAALLACLRGG